MRETRAEIDPTEVVRRFQESAGSDRAAREFLTGHYYPILRNHAVRFFSWSRKDTAAEALQNFFASKSGFETSIGRWKPGGRSLDNYVHYLFEQFCKKQRRTIQRRRETDFPDELDHPALTAPDRHDARFIETGVAVIVREVIIDTISRIEPAHYQRFLQMHFFFDAHLSRNEIARLLEVPLGTLGTGIKRAMDTLEQGIRIRLKKHGLDPEEALDVAGRCYEGLHDRALSRLRPDSLREFIEDVIEEGSALAAAEKNGLSSDEAVERLFEALEHFMKHSSYRRRRHTDFLARLSQVTPSAWARIVAGNGAGEADEERLAGQLRALFEGKPMSGLRDRLLAAAEPKGDYAGLARRLSVTSEELAEYVAGVEELPGPALTKTARLLGLSVEAARALDAVDRPSECAPRTRSRTSSARGLLKLETLSGREALSGRRTRASRTGSTRSPSGLNPRGKGLRSTL